MPLAFQPLPGVTANWPGVGLTPSVSLRVPLPFPIFALSLPDALPISPTASALADPFSETVTVALAPAANVPLVAERLSQLAVLLAVQSNELPPRLLKL